MKKILLVEDEPDLVLGLSDALSLSGYQVSATGSVSGARQLISQGLPDLCIIDLMLPDQSGFALCEELRRRSAGLPILILTARSQEADKLRGFAAGADDYVTKPFSVAELLARVGALLRRRAAPEAPSRFRIGEAEIDGSALTITKGGEELPLTVQELKLLEFLYARQGEAVSRDAILDAVWGTEAYPTPRTIDNFVLKLRKKVEKDPAHPEHILTVYGLGYKLVL